MRAFRRPNTVPPTLSDDGKGGRKRRAHIEDFRSGESPPFEFPGYWTEPDVRGALYAMQGRVCAYCGADIEEAGIDVEHFRPKGKVSDEDSHNGYWWLAYDFGNYLLSCTVCNQKCKRTAFPLEEGSERVEYEDRARLHEEKRILFDPASDDVEKWVYFDWASTAGLVKPHPDLGPNEAERVRRVLLFFRVNLKAPQRRRRLELQRVLLDNVERNKAEEVREFAIRFRPHSIVARQILAEKAPDLLPTPEQELEWLIANLSRI